MPFPDSAQPEKVIEMGGPSTALSPPRQEARAGSIESTDSCLCPPASLLIERLPLPSSPPSNFRINNKSNGSCNDNQDDSSQNVNSNIENNQNVKEGRHIISVSPPPTFFIREPAALRPTPNHKSPKSSPTSPPDDLPPAFTQSQREKQPIQEQQVARHAETIIIRSPWKGKLPAGDKCMWRSDAYAMVYPPPPPHAYPESSAELYQPQQDTSGNIDLSDALNSYAEDGAQLVGFLQTQSQDREEVYAPVALERDNVGALWKALDNENLEAYQRERIVRGRGGLKIQRPITPPPLSKKQMNMIHKRETSLVELMRDVTMNHAISEGTIAGKLTLNWDYAHLEPTEHERWVLHEAGGLDKHRLVEEEPEDDPDEILGPDPEKRKKKISKYKSELDDQLEDRRQAYREAFRAQHEREDEVNFTDDEFPTIDPALRPIRCMVPEWFHVFATYNIINFDRGNINKQFKAFLNLVSYLEEQVKLVEKPRWDKKWHEPSKAWPTRTRQKSGG